MKPLDFNLVKASCRMLQICRAGLSIHFRGSWT